MEKGINREKTNPLLPKSANGIIDAEYTLNIMKQAPVIITVINTNGINPFKKIDADTKVTDICDILSIGASVENILLEATELGIGTLWIANTFFAYPELVNFIGTENQLVSAIALGYPEESPNARLRKPLKDIIEYRI